MAALTEGYRDHARETTDGGGVQRWVLTDSAPRRPQAQRPTDTYRRRPGTNDLNAFTPLCRPAFAGEADAPQALAAFAQSLQATAVAAVALRVLPRYRQRGRPSHGAPPDQWVDQSEGALASSLAPREALVVPQSCCLLATHALEDNQLPPQQGLEASKGQRPAERGCRFRKDPQFLASARDLQKPQRSMALRMVMTVCLLVYAALDYRLRKGLKAHEATVPDQQGKRLQNPTARWGFPYCVGIHR
jgi:hypothetical protein